MKFIANSFAVLIVLALALGGVVYNAVSAHAKQGEPLILPKPNSKSKFSGYQSPRANQKWISLGRQYS